MFFELSNISPDPALSFLDVFLETFGSAEVLFVVPDTSDDVMASFAGLVFTGFVTAVFVTGVFTAGVLAIGGIFVFTVSTA